LFLLLPSFLTGFGIGFGLIVAIGAQNAYILRLGLKRAHVLPAVLFYAISDSLLICVGIAGLGQVIAAYPAALTLVTAMGILFLLAYGAMAARRALNPGAMALGEAEPPVALRQVLLACFAFTFLNPHVYLDTVILVGSLAAPFEGAEKLAYGLGAASASFTWFFALGYGARLLAPLFAKPAAWRILDAFIALIMVLIAGRLIMWMMAQP
jgi:L-lysine exporter family protein LysE/ArgO